MDLKAIRELSLAKATEPGYPTNPHLPLLDEPGEQKPSEDIVRRLLALNVAVSCAYGFDRSKVREWLEMEQVVEALAPSEHRFIYEGTEASEALRDQVESLWALAWAAGAIYELSFAKECAPQFVTMVPNLKEMEDSARFRKLGKHRPTEEWLEQLDLAYCLHWGVRNAALAGARAPGRVPPYVVIERRRALEWLVYEEPWDEISLDT